MQTVSIDVRAEGMSQVLVLSPYREDESVYKPKTRTDLIRSDSVDSLNAMSFETVVENTRPNLTISIDFEGLGLSVINRNVQEIVYLSFRGFKLSYSDYPNYYEAGFDCKWIQIDNQLYGGIF